MREPFVIALALLAAHILAWGWARNSEWMEWRRYVDRD